MPPGYAPPPGAPGYPPPAGPGYAPMYAAPPPKRATAITMLRDAFDTFMKDPFIYLGIYFVYALITGIITLVITLLAFNAPLAAIGLTGFTFNTGILALFIAVTIGVAIIDAIVGAVVAGMTTYFAVQRYRGSPATWNQALSEGMKRFLSILVAQILVSVAAVGLVLIPLLVVIAGAFLGDLALVGIGFVLFIILGILAVYLLVGWSLFAPAIMVEGQGAFGSLSRSWQLTRGHRLSIFAAGLVVLIVGAIVGGILGGIFGLAGPIGAAIGSILATTVTGSWIFIMTSVAHQLIVSEPRYGVYPAPAAAPPTPPAPPRA